MIKKKNKKHVKIFFLLKVYQNLVIRANCSTFVPVEQTNANQVSYLR